MSHAPIIKGSLPAEEARTRIEQALWMTLLLAHGQRITQIPATLDALRAVPRKGLSFGQLRFVADQGCTYYFDEYERGDDDGRQVIKPATAGIAGRWRRGGGNKLLDRYARRRQGFVRTVRVWAGEYDDEAVAELFALKPAYVLVPAGANNSPRSVVRNTWYQYEARWRLWCISQNLRRGPVALEGSRVPEDGEDPGLFYMVGAAKRALAHHDLGLAAVARVEFGSEDPVAHDLANRVHCEALGLTVYATQHFADEDIEPLDGLRVGLEMRQGEYDPQNYVAQGLRIPDGASLATAITAGMAYVAGVLQRVPAYPLTLPASRDTYRDLTPRGAWVIQDVAVDAPAPPAPPGALRIAMTRTSASRVVLDRYLCSTSLEVVEPFDIPRT